MNKPGWAPVKLPQTGRYSSYRYSIYSRSYSGPTFGRGFDIYISNYASHNNDSFTELGHTYSSVFTQFGSLRASSPGRSGGEAGKGRSQSARRASILDKNVKKNARYMFHFRILPSKARFTQDTPPSAQKNNVEVWLEHFCCLLNNIDQGGVGGGVTMVPNSQGGSPVCKKEQNS